MAADPVQPEGDVRGGGQRAGRRHRQVLQASVRERVPLRRLLQRRERRLHQHQHLLRVQAAL